MCIRDSPGTRAAQVQGHTREVAYSAGEFFFRLARAAASTALAACVERPGRHCGPSPSTVC
eukprot:7299525-Lingulodinium_polyedra.AAC.1